MAGAGDVCGAVGASTYVIGSACLVLLGHLVGCFAQDFAPSPVLVEAYLSLLGLVTAAGHHEQCTLTPGDSIQFIIFSSISYYFDYFKVYQCYI